MEYLVASSGGNDSIALMQFMHEKGKDFGVVYNNTGWARDDWATRIKQVSEWCFNRGVTFFETKPARFENRHAKGFDVNPGFEELVAHNGGFPMPASKMQWCTMHLKEAPTIELLDRIDHDCELTIVTGRRREESQNRRDLSQYQDESAKHGGRDVWNPLYVHNELMRDELIKRAGFEPLPHSSMECYPCVCANKSDLNEMLNDPLAKSKILRLVSLEIELGHTRNGKPRTMFRPYRVGGGVGFEEALNWSESKGWKANHVPRKYQIKDVDYSGYRGGFTVEEKASFWAGIKKQCIALGYDMKNLESDVAYDENTKEGREFARQCDGGYYGN